MLHHIRKWPGRNSTAALGNRMHNRNKGMQHNHRLYKVWGSREGLTPTGQAGRIPNPHSGNRAEALVSHTVTAAVVAVAVIRQVVEGSLTAAAMAGMDNDLSFTNRQKTAVIPLRIMAVYKKACARSFFAFRIRPQLLARPIFATPY